MKTSELDGCALDYWCARALVDDDEEVIFNQVEPGIVVTLTHGAWRKLAQPFSPAGNWADASEVLERASELQWARGDDGAHCRARFGETLVDVTTDGFYVEQGATIEVIEVQGSKVIVKRAAERGYEA